MLEKCSVFFPYKNLCTNKIKDMYVKRLPQISFIILPFQFFCRMLALREMLSNYAFFVYLHLNFDLIPVNIMNCRFIINEYKKKTSIYVPFFFDLVPVLLYSSDRKIFLLFFYSLLYLLSVDHILLCPIDNRSFLDPK